MGHVDDMRALLRSVDIVALPSYREGLPKGLIEAGASDCTLMATDVPGCREGVTREVDELRMPVRDSVALPDAIEPLERDPAMHTRLGAAARAKVVTQFDESMVLENAVDVSRAGGVTFDGLEVAGEQSGARRASTPPLGSVHADPAQRPASCAYASAARRLGKWMLALVMAVVLASVALPASEVAWMRENWAWFNRPMLLIEQMDTAVNVVHGILFLALGMAARAAWPCWGPWRVLAAMLVFGVATELVQFLVPGRHPRLADVAVDVVAGVLGWAAARGLLR